AGHGGVAQNKTTASDGISMRFWQEPALHFAFAFPLGFPDASLRGEVARGAYDAKRNVWMRALERLIHPRQVLTGFPSNIHVAHRGNPQGLERNKTCVLMRSEAAREVASGGRFSVQLPLLGRTG